MSIDWVFRCLTGMKKKTPSVKQDEEELPFSFSKKAITPEKTDEHWQKIADELKFNDNPPEQEKDDIPPT